MTVRDKRLHPALKHGGYSAATLLRGEDRGAFEKLHRNLISEFSPVGALEEDIVETITHLMWRKQNLRSIAGFGSIDEEIETDKPRHELFGDAATISGLLQELAVRERLDGCIDRCLKRLLFVRGLKSMSQESSGARPKQLSAPNRVA
jgi:hypothetical protein